MGIPGRRMLLLVLAALALVGGGVEAALAAPSHGAPDHGRGASGGVSWSSHGATCILPAVGLRFGATARSTATPAGRRPTAHSGTLVVAIPATVFIRPVGRWLSVTTNTGSLPAPGDEFWLIANGHASPANAWLRGYVEFGCSAFARHGHHHRG